MAEIGLIASLVGIVGIGTQLSIGIFDFASSVGQAGRELQHIGTEISLLCAVLEQVEALLEHAHFQPSTSAKKTVQKIVDQCSKVFGEIDSIVADLRTAKGHDLFPTVDFTSKVKWTFSKKSKVLMLRSTLESCKLTLSVMLSTMQQAESVSQRQEFSVIQYEQHKAMTQSLVMSQQCAVEQLEYYEDEVEREQDMVMQLSATDAANPSNVPNRRKSRGRLGQMFSGLSLVTNLPTSSKTPLPLQSRGERASIWLDESLAPEDGPAEPHPGRQRQRRMSSVGTANAPLQLLRKWTDQGGSINPRVKRQETGRSTIDSTDPWRDSEFAFPDALPYPPVENIGQPQSDSSGPSLGITKRLTDLISPKTARVQSIGFHIVAGINGTLESSGELTTTTLSEDSYEAIRNSILKEHGCTTSGHEMVLCISYGGKIKVLKSSDKPLEVFEHYEDLELEPRFFVRRSAG